MLMQMSANATMEFANADIQYQHISMAMAVVMLSPHSGCVSVTNMLTTFYKLYFYCVKYFSK